jgi:hypothetical protein
MILQPCLKSGREHATGCELFDNLLHINCLVQRLPVVIQSNGHSTRFLSWYRSSEEEAWRDTLKVGLSGQGSLSSPNLRVLAWLGTDTEAGGHDAVSQTLPQGCVWMKSEADARGNATRR